MRFEERNACALDAVRPRIEQFHSALVVTAEQTRALLGASGDTKDDQDEALGFFAKGKMDLERFASFAPKDTGLDAEAEAPVRAAQEVLKALAPAPSTVTTDPKGTALLKATWFTEAVTVMRRL